jgi:DNA-binding transcriptional LysR family regulator
VSQPAVSRLIRYLEIKLNVALFERTGGRLHPTPEARALMREIDAAYRGIDRVRLCAEQLRHGVADTLRISTNLSPALELVPRAIAELKAAMPRLHISVEIATHAQITEQLLAGECDLGVAAFVQVQHPAVTAQLIGEGDVLCAMAATHPLASRKRIKLDELLQHDLISFGAETPHGKLVGSVLGTRRAAPSPTVEVRYAYVACGIAASGWGVALVDDLSASRFGREGLALRPLAKPVRYQAYALGSAERPLSAVGREMARLLAQHWSAVREQPRRKKLDNA